MTRRAMGEVEGGKGPAGDAPQGFILVTVLWILGALAALVSIYALYVSGTVSGAVTREEALASEGLTRAAIELVALRLASVPPEQQPRHGEVAFRLGSARVTADFQEESARLDLNAAPLEHLVALFEALGARGDAARQYAQRIIGWRTRPEDSGSTAEADLYRAAGLDYEPRGAPFVHVDELWQVLGIPPEMVAAALDHVTVYSGKNLADAREADPVVRAALAASATAVEPGRSDAVRVRVNMAFESGRRRAAEVVILVRDFAEEPYGVLSWRDEIEPAAGRSQEARP